MPKYGHINSGDDFIKNQMEFQSGFPNPDISDNLYLRLPSEFIPRFESCIPAPYEIKSGIVSKFFPNEFLNSDEYKNIAKEGFYKFGVIKISELAEDPNSLIIEKEFENAVARKLKLYSEMEGKYKPSRDDAIKYLKEKGNPGERNSNLGFNIVQSLCSELRERYGVMAAHYTLKDKSEGIDDMLLVCFPYKIAKNNDKWEVIPDKKALSKFFAFTVAKGLVEKEALYENGIMLGARNHEILARIKKLKDEVVEPILKEPLIKASNKQEVVR